MGKPTRGNARVSPDEGEGNRVNWNISVTRGKENECDSPSSGERKGNSPNAQQPVGGCLWFADNLRILDYDLRLLCG